MRAILSGARPVVLLLTLLLVGCGEPIDQTRSRQAPGPVSLATPAAFDAEQAAPFVQLALDCVDQEYPNKIGHTMRSDADQGTPRSLHPAFYGCFDWHSSVHGHWLLARFARLHPDHELSGSALGILQDHLTPAKIQAETAYLLAEGRASWERPYGLAWLLQLVAELEQWSHEDDLDVAPLRTALAPLERACVQRVSHWLPRLTYPIRTGEHSQTAFAFGLMLDYARAVDDELFAALLRETTLRLYGQDRDVGLGFEPSGQDFLSPALAEADLMRRVLEPEEFALWLEGFLPAIPRHMGAPDATWLPPAVVSDRSDGKLAHLDGLNLSRAWMLEGMAAGLPAGDVRTPHLLATARENAHQGLAAVTGEHYAGGHWLGTYAMYLGSRRGLALVAPQTDLGVDDPRPAP